MENTSKHNNALSMRDIAYYRRRQQNRVFAEIVSFFAAEAEKGHITRKQIAEKLSKDPAQITRWLSAPSNMTIDAISDILLAMDAEMDHGICRFADRAEPNYTHPLMIEPNEIRKVLPVPAEPEKAAPPEAVIFKGGDKVQAIKPTVITSSSSLECVE
jgi:hypothetical protein